SKTFSERTETEEGPRGTFQVLRCQVENNSEKTISNITMSIACRSWQKLKLVTFKDTGPVDLRFDGGPPTLNPHQVVEFVFFSQSVNDADQIYLGDHKNQDAQRIEIPRGEGTHFITLAIGAADTALTIKNMVVLTLSPAKLISLEFDSRRWGHHGNSPT